MSPKFMSPILEFVSLLLYFVTLYSVMMILCRTLFSKLFHSDRKLFWLGIPMIIFISFLTIYAAIFNSYGYFYLTNTVAINTIISFILSPFAYFISKKLGGRYFRIAAIIILFILFLIPKTSGSFASQTPDGTNGRCQCIGLVMTKIYHNSSEKLCLGINYSCKKVPALIEYSIQ